METEKKSTKTVQDLLKEKKQVERKIGEILSGFYKNNKEIQMIYVNVDTTEVHENGELVDLIFETNLDVSLWLNGIKTKKTTADSFWAAL